MTLTQLFQNLREFQIESKGIEFADQVIPRELILEPKPHEYGEKREALLQLWSVCFNQLFHFDDPEFADVKQSKCTPGKSYNCKSICLTKDKQCRFPFEGQAKNYADWMAMQKKGSQIEKLKNPSTDSNSKIKTKNKKIDLKSSATKDISKNKEKVVPPEVQKPKDKGTTDDTLRSKIQEVDKKYSTALNSATSALEQAKEKRAKGSKSGPTAKKNYDKIGVAEDKLAELKKTIELAKNELIYNLAKASYKEPSPQREQGMSESENLWSIDLSGIKYHASGDLNVNHPVIDLIRQASSLPEKFTKHTDNVYISSQRNKDDEYWSQAYDIPDAESSATGGGGKVVYYGGRHSFNVLIHEMGHNLAFGLFGSANPPSDSEYALAASKSEAPTKYGQTNLAEDFAETAKLYFQNSRVSSSLKSTSPDRYEAFKKLIEN